MASGRMPSYLQRSQDRAPPARRFAAQGCSLYVVPGLAREVILVRFKKHFRGGRSLLKAGIAPDLHLFRANYSWGMVARPSWRPPQYRVARTRQSRAGRTDL